MGTKTMQPIRSNELNYWQNVIWEKFAKRKKELETDLFQEVKVKARQAQSAFNKKLRVDSKLDQLKKASNAYNDFVANKEKIEREMQQKVAMLVDEIRTDLKNWNEVRQWENSNCNSIKSLTAVEEFLEEVCYEETKEAYMKSEKGRLLAELNNSQDEARNVLHSGGSITDVVQNLDNIFKRTKIEVRIPKTLLAIGN
jgi:hypothetical protein